MLIRIWNCNLLGTSPHSPPFIHQNVTRPKVSLLTVCLMGSLTLMDQIIATWLFFRWKWIFSLLFFFFSSSFHVCDLFLTTMLLHFLTIINTNSQHFQGLYFVSIFTAEGPLILPSINQSLLHMSLLNELLSSLLQVGQLYAQQGAVREAFRRFVDGLTLARHFALP